MAAVEHVARMQQRAAREPGLRKKHSSFGRSPSPSPRPRRTTRAAAAQQPPRRSPSPATAPSSPVPAAAAARPPPEPEPAPPVVFASPRRNAPRWRPDGGNGRVLARAAQRAAESNRAAVVGLLERRSSVGVAPASWEWHERGPAPRGAVAGVAPGALLLLLLLLLLGVAAVGLAVAAAPPSSLLARAEQLSAALARGALGSAINTTGIF
jgi:hypothetical protein